MSTVTQNVYQGKYGFHSCNYETYVKLKKLHKWYWKTVADYARWYRWDRKDPKNRFYWDPRISRSDKRVRSTRPIPEPKFCSVFVFRPGYVLWNAISDFNIVAVYKNARMPKENPDNVKQVFPYGMFKKIDLNKKDFEESVNLIYEEARRYFERE